MFRCIFIKRKLYDYLDNGLSETDKVEVKGHLDGCNKCSQHLGRLKNILDAASERKAPWPNTEFWHNFRIELDRKLNEKLVGPVTLKPRLSYRLKPAFTCALTLIFILALGNYFYKNRTSPHLRVTQDEGLVDELDALDDVDETAAFDSSGDSYMDELSFFYQLDES